MAVPVPRRSQGLILDMVLLSKFSHCYRHLIVDQIPACSPSSLPSAAEAPPEYSPSSDDQKSFDFTTSPFLSETLGTEKTTVIAGRIRFVCVYPAYSGYLTRPPGCSHFLVQNTQANAMTVHVDPSGSNKSLSITVSWLSSRIPAAPNTIQ